MILAKFLFIIILKTTFTIIQKNKPFCNYNQMNLPSIFLVYPLLVINTSHSIIFIITFLVLLILLFFILMAHMIFFFCLLVLLIRFKYGLLEIWILRQIGKPFFTNIFKSINVILNDWAVVFFIAIPKA